GDACALQLISDEFADLDILVDVIAVALPLLGGVSKPTGAVISGDTEPVSMWVYLLAHSYRAPSFRSATTTVMWLVRLRICAARPCARGRNLFMVGPSSTYASAITRSSSSNRADASSALKRALAIAELMTLETVLAADWGANSNCVSASL